MSVKERSQGVPHVVIVGAGFGGLRTARALAGASVRITLVDRQNYHLFQPLLYQVATAGLSPEDIARPVRAILRKQQNVDFHMTEVTNIDLNKQQVHTSTGTLDYDYLVVAAGGRNNYFGMQSVERNSFGMKNIDEAIILRNHVLRMFELAEQETDSSRRQALLTFMIVGGGPTGVECAGALSELIHHVLIKDYSTLNFAEVRIILAEAGNSLLPALPEELRAATGKILKDKHIEVNFGTAVSDYDGEVVMLKDGGAIATHTLIWAAGIQAAEIVAGISANRASLNRVVVEPTLQIKEYPQVFVIGDAAFFMENGKPLPMTAIVALQQADMAAKNIRRSLAGQQPTAFSYKDIGVMATIGRNAAVCSVGRLQMYGFFAWVLWSLIHVLQLVGFRNRFMVFIKWAWDYVFYERAVRLITRQ